MYTGDWVLIGILAVIIVFIGYLLWNVVRALLKHRRTQRARRNENLVWAEAVMAAKTDEAVVALDKMPWEGDSRQGIEDAATRYRRSETAVRQQEREAAEALREAEQAAERVEATQVWESIKALPASDRYEKLTKFLAGREAWPLDKEALAEAQQDLGQLTKTRAVMLYDSARAGDVKKLYELLKLTNVGDYSWSTSAYEDLTGDPYVCPEGWDEVIARFVECPPLGYFASFDEEPDPGTIRLRAAEALRDESLTQAKLVLAYADTCDDDGQYRLREEIGNIFIVELTKMVARLHEEQGLTFLEKPIKA